MVNWLVVQDPGAAIRNLLTSQHTFCLHLTLIENKDPIAAKFFARFCFMIDPQTLFSSWRIYMSSLSCSTILNISSLKWPGYAKIPHTGDTESPPIQKNPSFFVHIYFMTGSHILFWPAGTVKPWEDEDHLWMNELINYLTTTVFEEQPLALPGSAKKTIKTLILISIDIKSLKIYQQLAVFSLRWLAWMWAWGLMFYVNSGFSSAQEQIYRCNTKMLLKQKFKT